MKFLPHWVVLGLLLVTIGAAVVVPKLWFLPIVIAVFGVLYILMNRHYAAQEGERSRMGADRPGAR